MVVCLHWYDVVTLKNDDWRKEKFISTFFFLFYVPGVVENNFSAVEAYLSCGGNPGRSLTNSEVALLNRNSAFDVGHTLIHLAIRFHREEMLPMLLAQISGSGPGIKRVNLLTIFQRNPMKYSILNLWTGPFIHCTGYSVNNSSSLLCIVAHSKIIFQLSLHQ